MDELVHAIVKSYGLIGVFMLSPVIATIYLWRDNIRLNNEMRALSAKYVEQVDSLGQRVVAVQDKRVDDSKSISDKLVALVTEHVAQAKEQTLALDRVGDMVSMLLANNSSQPPPQQPPMPRNWRDR